MARGVRKTPIEKLNEELVKTQEEMQNHKNAIKSSFEYDRTRSWDDLNYTI